MSGAPETFTSRFFNHGLLTGGRVVPVSMSPHTPHELGIEVPYPLEVARTLIPDPEVLGEWREVQERYWQHLDDAAEEIEAELREIAERHDGLPLALLCWEDTALQGHGCHRRVFQAWHEERTGSPVYELLGSGRALHHTDLHPRRKVRRPT